MLAVRPDKNEAKKKLRKERGRTKHYGCKVICAGNGSGSKAPPLILPKLNALYDSEKTKKINMLVDGEETYGYVLIPPTDMNAKGYL